jgi:hypothetical protein
MNPINFFKMADGDLARLRELLFDYFNDTRRQMTSWLALLETEFTQAKPAVMRMKYGPWQQ